MTLSNIGRQYAALGLLDIPYMLGITARPAGSVSRCNYKTIAKSEGEVFLYMSYILSIAGDKGLLSRLGLEIGTKTAVMWRI